MAQLVRSTSNAAFVNEYLDYMLTVLHRSPNTAYGYAQSYKKFLATLPAGRSLLDVTADDVQAFLSRPRVKVRGDGPSPATIKCELAELRALFAWMVDVKHLRQWNPAKAIPMPTVHNEDPHPVDDETWLAVWTWPELPDDMRVALGLGYFCGLRRHEVTLLKASQFVDLPTPRITSVKRKGGKRVGFAWRSCVDLYAQRLPHLIVDPDLFLGSLERLRRQRAAAPALLPWREQRNERRVTRLVHEQPDGFINPHLFNARLGALLRRVGLKADAFTPHSLRHSFCTNLVDAGVDILAVQQLAGHSDIRVTQRYVRLREDPLASYLAGEPAASVDEVQLVGRWR